MKKNGRRPKKGKEGRQKKNLKKNGRRTNQPKSIGCDTIVNSPSYSVNISQLELIKHKGKKHIPRLDSWWGFMYKCFFSFVNEILMSARGNWVA